MSVTAEQKQLLQFTAGVLKEQGKEIMSNFYAALFKDHPEYKNYFNETNQQTGKQPEAMAETIYSFVQNLDNLNKIKPQMSRLSSKHRAVGVKPELYPTLGKYLIQSITQELGGLATPEVVSAWNALYGLMASTFIKKEKELYAQLGNDQGFVPFNITKKDQVASGPTFLVTLQRKDGGQLWKNTPGQYITLQTQKDGFNHQGHYTLLQPFNSQDYQIAFKQGKATDQNTVVNNEIGNNLQVGSTVLVSAPAGSFGLVEGAKNSLFIGGGIGVTSLVPLITAATQQNQSVSVIQCVRSPDNAVFQDQFKALPQGQYTLLTEQQPISTNDLQGKVNADTHVYISGSEIFIDLVQKALAPFYLPKSRVHPKSIEPTLGLLKAIA